MAATTTQTIRLLDCPVCGEPIEAAITYDVRRDENSIVRPAEKVVLATLTMTGARILHACPPKRPDAARRDIVSRED